MNSGYWEPPKYHFMFCIFQVLISLCDEILLEGTKIIIISIDPSLLPRTLPWIDDLNQAIEWGYSESDLSQHISLKFEWLCFLFKSTLQVTCIVFPSFPKQCVTNGPHIGWCLKESMCQFKGNVVMKRWCHNGSSMRYFHCDPIALWHITNTPESHHTKLGPPSHIDVLNINQTLKTCNTIKTS